MKAQTPAEGILKTNDFGNSKWYKVICHCGNDDDAFDFEVEADENGINVNTYFTQKTDYWSETFKPRYNIDSIWLQEIDWFVKGVINDFINKIKLSWTIWSKGYLKVQSTTILTEQQALNYAETLKSAIKDVKQFQQERKAKYDVSNKIAKKLAEENDCI